MVFLQDDERKNMKKVVSVMSAAWRKAGAILLTLENQALEAANQAADASGLPGAPPPGSDYIAFDIETLKAAAATIRASAGSIFNGAIWAFLVVLGVFTAIDFFR